MTKKTDYQQGEFSWVDLVAHDLSAAIEFYGNFFGWRSAAQDTASGPPYTMFQLDGADVAGAGQMSDEMKGQGVPPMWNSYIQVDDIAATTARAVELGATVTVQPMQVMDAGHLSFITDPTGAHVGFWQKGRHCGASVLDEPGSLCWNELATRDIDRAREFYGQLLGWQFTEQKQDRPTTYLLCQMDGVDKAGMLQMNEQWGDIPPVWIVYFAVADAHAATARFTELSGTIRVPPFPSPVGTIAVVSDPQGAVFSLLDRSTRPA